MASSPEFIRQSLATNGSPRLLKRVRVAGTPTQVFTLDYYNQNKDHVVFVWRYGRIMYLASVHGLRNQTLARGLAKGLIERMGG
jgi:hypothetical protein